ncbi:MAG: hypothetical protein HC851_08065 [Acaryochloris sp. RU_4_1]|nr:hypothetical protein [Acaryochloris sp. RU_4_1]NJR54379.1 hypothetical protein [Acaryochloris sp. CRU_2_0]
MKIPTIPELIAVLQQNIDWVPTKEQLDDIFAGQIYSPTFDPGCITALTYGENGVLSTVMISGITLTSIPPTPSTATPNAQNLVTNLDNFKDQFQEAANFRQSVSLLINRKNGEIVRLTTFPCQCQCDEPEKVSQPVQMQSSRGNCTYVVTYPNGYKKTYVAPCP